MRKPNNDKEVALSSPHRSNSVFGAIYQEESSVLIPSTVVFIPNGMGRESHSLLLLGLTPPKLILPHALTLVPFTRTGWSLNN